MIRLCRLWLAVFASLALSQQAAAFSAMERDDCKAAWQVVALMVDHNEAETHSVSEDGWCQAPRSSIGDVNLEWRAEGIERVLQDKLPPTALTIRVSGIEILDVLGEPSRPHAPKLLVNVLVVLRENADKKQLMIETIEIAGPTENKVVLRGVLHDVDLSSHATMQVSIGRAKLGNLDLVATGNRKLAPFLQPYIGATFPERSRKRSAMIDKVSAWPDHNFPPATKRAVKQLIATLPAPNGTLRATLDTGAGLSIGVFIQTFVFGSGGKTLLDNIIEKLVFHATWTAH